MNLKIVSVLLIAGLLLTICGILSIALNIRIPTAAPSVTPSVTPLGQVALPTPTGIVPVTGNGNNGLQIILYGLLGVFAIVVFSAVYNALGRNSSTNDRSRH